VAASQSATRSAAAGMSLSEMSSRRTVVGLAGDEEAFGAGGGEGAGGAGAVDEAEVEGPEALFEPAEVVVLAVGHELEHAGGEVEAVDDPGVVALEFEEAGPGGVGFHGLRFFVRLEVDEAAAPGEVGEGAPFAGDERGVVAVAAGADDARVFVEGEGEVGLEGQARAFEDDLGGEFRGHGQGGMERWNTGMRGRVEYWNSGWWSLEWPGWSARLEWDEKTLYGR
jgi:hypothetical protein